MAGTDMIFWVLIFYGFCITLVTVAIALVALAYGNPGLAKGMVKEFFHFAGNAVKNAAPWSSPGESSADSGEDD